jgi:tetratricopeptide (TPR) repeat protein
VNQAERPNEPGPSVSAREFVQQYQAAVQAGRMEDAEAAAWNLVALMGQQAATQPDPEMLLLTEASNHEAAADWPGAEVAYRKVLERAIATGDVTSQYRAYAGLSGLFQLVGAHTTAIEQAHSATAAARQADLPILLAMALERQAACALRLNQLSEALSAVEEALRCMVDEKVYDVQRGRCLILRAECNLKLGSTAAAESDLNVAWQLLEAPSAMRWAAGVHSALARWW